MAIDTDSETPQPAGFWIRLAARMLDSVILGVPAGLVFAWLTMSIPGFSRKSLLMRFILWLPYLIYTLSFWIWKGATPGKMLFSLLIVRASDFQRPSVGQLIGRYFSYILSALPLGLGYLWIGWDPRKQGFHDHLANTLVVKRSETEAKQGWQIALGIGAVLGLLALVGILSGVVWLRHNKDRFREAGLQVKAEAAEFGKTHDAQQCLEEALRRSDNCKGFSCHAMNNVFLRIALQASRPTPGFCDGIPPKSEIMRTAVWETERCGHLGRSQDHFCGQLFRQVQLYCAEDNSQSATATRP